MGLTRPLTRALARSLTRGINSEIVAVVTISGDAYAGSLITVEGGEAPYEYIINSVASGVFTDDPVPLTVVEGDEIQVRDANGVFSNVLLATDALTGLDFVFKGYGLPEGAFQDSGLTIPADTDADPFGGWVDENGVAFVQAVSGNRGQLKNVSGSWVWRGDGVDDFLTRSNFDLSGDFTIFVKQSTTGDGILVGSNGSNNQLLRIGDGGNNRLSYFEGGTQYFSDALAATRGVPNVVGIIKSGSDVTFYEGVDSRGSFTSVTAVTAGAIGAAIISSTPANPTTGDIYAVLIADTDMTDNLSQLNNALNQL